LLSIQSLLRSSSKTKAVSQKEISYLQRKTSLFSTETLSIIVSAVLRMAQAAEQFVWQAEPIVKPSLVLSPTQY
jgi:hypothetical protein